MSANPFGIDNTLIEAVLQGTTAGLSMAAIEPRAAGLSRMSISPHEFNLLVGLVGERSGTLSMSFSRQGMLHVASGMMGEPWKELDEVALDCVMEIANIVAGDVKSSLDATAYAIHHISLPSMVFGGQYVYFSKGMHTCSITFELPGMPMTMFADRLFHTTISLLPASGL